MAYELSRAEQETIITFDRESNVAEVYTAGPVMMRRLDKLASENPALAQKKEDAYSRTYSCPKSWVKLRKPPVLREETRKELASRFKQ